MIMRRVEGLKYKNEFYEWLCEEIDRIEYYGGEFEFSYDTTHYVIDSDLIVVTITGYGLERKREVFRFKEKSKLFIWLKINVVK